MRIVNFGSCNVDHVYKMEDHIVKVGETLSCCDLSFFEGGKGLNQSVAISRAGAKVYHAGCIGRDGQMLADLLERSGVDISYVQRVDASNGHAVIQVDPAGNNSIFIYPGTNGMIYEEYIDRVLEDFCTGDILLLQNETSNVKYIIDKAHEKGLSIVFNPSPFNEVISSIDLNKVTYLMINEVEGEALTGSDDPDRIISDLSEKYPQMRVILTLGHRGSVYYDREHKIVQSAYSVLSVDSTAAGDTFTGYFVAGIAGGKTVAEALRFASAAASLSVSKLGAAPSIPLAGEVKKALNWMVPIVFDAKEEQRKRINDYVDKSLRCVTLQDIADHLKYSKNYTGALIKRLMGMNYIEYLHSKRCARAEELLKSTDKSINDILSEIGYENGSFFRKKFKERYGSNPLEYRKQQQEDK